MALIEYRIIVDEFTNTAEVRQDVRQIGPGVPDRVRYVATNATTLIRFDPVKGSPNPGVFPPGVPTPVPIETTIPPPPSIPVTNPNAAPGVPFTFVPGFGNRKTFPFECGRLVGGGFQPWGGAGGNTPDGGSDGTPNG